MPRTQLAWTNGDAADVGRAVAIVAGPPSIGDLVEMWITLGPPAHASLKAELTACGVKVGAIKL